jgi:hypothetical protein
MLLTFSNDNVSTASISTRVEMEEVQPFERDRRRLNAAELNGRSKE